MSMALLDMDSPLIVLNPEDRYYPGGVIKGKIRYVLTKQEYIQGVTVELKGRESTEWSEDIAYHDRVADDLRRGPVQYYGLYTIVQSRQNIKESGIDGPGTYEYPFQFDLDTWLPNSYIGMCGEIVYHLKAVVKLPDNILLYREIKEIVVMGKVNLNYIPNLNLDPVTLSDEITVVNCCSASSGLVLMDLYLPKAVYTIGENIQPIIRIKNQSGEPLQYIHAEISRVLVEKVVSPEPKTKSDRKIIASEQVPNFNGTILTFDFNIVSPLHNFGSSKLFNELFILKVTAKIIDNEPLRIEVPLIVGEIPLDDVGLLESNSSTSRPNHMNIPGGTPYPPPMASAPPETYVPSAPSAAMQEVPAVMEELPPSYQDVMKNPAKFTTNR